MLMSGTTIKKGKDKEWRLH